MIGPIFRRSGRRGSAILEFALVGIPIVFAWISVVQMALGMWRYHSLQHAVKVTGAYVSVHGYDCTLPGNNCRIAIQNAARVLQANGSGFDPNTVDLTFRIVRADHVTKSAEVTCTLKDCLSNPTPWPPTGWDQPNQDNVEIDARYTFRSALGMMFPGAGAVRFGVYRLSATTRQMILF